MLLDSHLDQITSSARAIGELEFPLPKSFTNALLGSHEITTLIRDTEPHERALFLVDPGVAIGLNSQSERRATVFPGESQTKRKSIHPLQQRQSSAVAKVLGNDMLRQIQQSSRTNGKRGINVEVLLQGAERLCSVYSVTGASERISALRKRHGHIMASVNEYEVKIAKQQSKLNRMNSSNIYDQTDEDETVRVAPAISSAYAMTEDDMRAEEEEIKELEAKKKALEDRVADMEKDLGGLLR